MYAKIINEETKQVEVGEGTNSEFYKSIGMIETEVEKGWDGHYYLVGHAPEKPIEEKKAEARAERDRRIDAIRWRIERYQTQLAIGVETSDTETKYKKILKYIQALRDITLQGTFPEYIEWPKEPQ